MRHDSRDSWVVALIGLGMLLVALALMAAIVGCSRGHDDKTPLPSATATDSCERVCYPWSGHGEAKVIKLPSVDTCEIGGVCYYHCGRQ